MFLATRCAACGTAGPSPCPSCIAAMTRCPPLPVPDGLDGCRALLRYEGPAREVVARLKYRNERASVPWIAAGMAALVEPSRFDVVTWAPTTVDRRRSRGFDHAEILARRVGRRAGLPSRSLLTRGAGPAQTGRSQEDRLRGPSFEPVRRIDGRRVLVVDDVVTTGATLSAAAEALRGAGARSVTGLAAAHPSRT